MADTHRFKWIIAIAFICGFLILTVNPEAIFAAYAEDPVLDGTCPEDGDRDMAISHLIISSENPGVPYGGADVTGGISDDCNGNGIPDSEEVGPPFLEEAWDSRDYQGGDQASRCVPTPADRNGNCIPDGCEDSILWPQGIIVVDDDGPHDPGPGDPQISDPMERGSPLHPFDCLQEAIDAAPAYGAVVVLNGTYTGPGNRDIDFLGKAVTVRSLSGPAGCIIDPEGLGRGFIFQNGETSTSQLQGLTIQNGYVEEGYGGGIFCHDSGPSIQNCVIQNNTSVAINSGGGGGGIGCYNFCNPSIIECVIRDNVAVNSYGGGVYGGSGDVTLLSCTIQDNTADKSGGGFYGSGTTGTMSNCSIIGNKAVKYYGGGLRTYSIKVTQCKISNNWAKLEGGGIHGGKISFCIISNNNARYGGGIHSSGEVENCAIINNTARRSGGGLWGRYNGSQIVANCLIADNTARWGGGLYYNADLTGIEIRHCTIVNNHAKYSGGGIEAYGDGIDFWVSNTIIWNNQAPTGSAVYLVTSDLLGHLVMNLSYSDFVGTTYTSMYAHVIWKEGMIETDPLLVDPDQGDYHLSSGSPCIDAGDPDYVPEPGETDLEGDPREVNGRVDMGADEYVE